MLGAFRCRRIPRTRRERNVIRDRLAGRRAAAAAAAASSMSSSVGTTFSMPVIATCTRGRLVTMRPLPSLVTISVEPVSATMKFAPVMPMSADRKCGRSISRASRVSSAMTAVRGRRCFCSKRSDTSSRVLCTTGATMCDGGSFASWRMYFAEIGFDHFDAGSFQRIVERALLADHRFRLRGLAHAVFRGELADDAIHVRGRFGPVHDRAARGRVAFELFEIDVEMLERTVADLRSRIADSREVVELGYPLGASLHEIVLELFERRLQARVGELDPGRRFEAVGRQLHLPFAWSARMSHTARLHGVGTFTVFPSCTTPPESHSTSRRPPCSRSWWSDDVISGGSVSANATRCSA